MSERLGSVESKHPQEDLRKDLVERFGLTARIQEPTAKDKRSFLGKERDKMLQQIRDLTENKEAWKGVNRGLVVQAMEHLVKAYTKPFAPDDKPELLVFASSDRERALTCKAVGGTLLLKLEDQKVKAKESIKFSGLDVSPIVRRLFGLKLFSVNEASGGGVSFEGGLPAEFRDTIFNAQVGGSEELLAVVQAVEFYPHLRQAIVEAMERKLYAIASFDPTGIRAEPFEYEGEYLFERVERVVLEAVQNALLQGDFHASQLLNVEAKISAQAITPVAVLDHPTTFFHVSMPGERRVELPTAKLKTPLPLVLDHVDVQPPASAGHWQRPFRLDFDKDHGEKIEFSGDFYRSGMGGAKLKVELLWKLKQWMDKQGWKKEPETPSKKKDVPYFLNLLDIDEKAFRELPSDHDRHSLVLRKAKSLVLQFHPDRVDEHQNPAEKETATQMTKEILEARDVLSAAYPG